MDINVQELSSLLANERFKAGEETKSLIATSAPNIYRGMLASPFNPGTPLADAALGMIAPAIGSSMGMQNPRVIPTVTPSMSVFDARYIADMNNQFATNSRDAFTSGMGGQMGAAFGQMANNLGFNRLLGMSPQQLGSTMVDFGQSQIGRFLAQQMMSTPQMQSIMGGDPLAMQQSIFSNRHALSVVPGQPMSPLDIGAQIGATQHARDVNASLLRAIYPTGITPDYNFTRGFKTEELGELASVMAQRGANTIGNRGETITQGMRGMDVDPGRKTQAVGEMARVLESVRDIMGGGDLRQLMMTLDSLTQMQWPQINKQKLEQVFREMGASAHILGVSGPVMMEATQRAQADMGSIAGVNTGAYVSLPVAAQLATSSLAIADRTGKPLSQVMAQQTAAAQMAMASSRGADVQQLAYLAQEGMISPEAFANFQKVNALGDVGQASVIANNLLTQAWGGGGVGRRISNNPVMMQQIRERTTDPMMGQIAMEMMFTGQARELIDRTRQDMSSNITQSVGQLQRLTGVTGLNYDARSEAQYVGAIRFLKSPEAGTAGTHLANLVVGAFDRGKTPAYGMTNVRRLIGGVEFEGIRDPLMRSMSAAADETRYNNLIAEGVDNTEMTAGIQAMRLMFGFDDPSVRALQRMRTSISSRGTSEDDRRRLSGELIERYAATVGGLEADQRISVKAAEGRAVQDRDVQLKVLQGQVTAQKMLNQGNTLGLGFANVFSEANALAGIMTGFSRGAITGADATDIVSNQLYTLDAATKKRYTDAFAADPNSGQADTMNLEARNTRLQLSRSGMAVQAQRAGWNVGEAISDRIKAHDIIRNLQGNAPGLAQIESWVTDMNQDWRMTLSQRAVKALTSQGGLSKLSIADILGVEEGGEAMRAIGKNDPNVTAIRDEAGKLSKPLNEVSDLTNKLVKVPGGAAALATFNKAVRSGTAISFDDFKKSLPGATEADLRTYYDSTKAIIASNKVIESASTRLMASPAGGAIAREQQRKRGAEAGATFAHKLKIAEAYEDWRDLYAYGTDGPMKMGGAAFAAVDVDKLERRDRGKLVDALSGFLNMDVDKGNLKESMQILGAQSAQDIRGRVEGDKTGTKATQFKTLVDIAKHQIYQDETSKEKAQSSTRGGRLRIEGSMMLVSRGGNIIGKVDMDGRGQIIY